MDNRYPKAELLVALWRLGADSVPLPLHGGILDQAILDCRAVLPPLLAGDLSFGTTSVGMRCYELDDIVLAAQELLLLDVSGSTGTTAVPRIGVDAARELAIGYGLSTAEASEHGMRLVEAVRMAAKARRG